QLAFDRDNRLLLSTRGGLRPQADPAGEEAQEERDDDEAAEDDPAAEAEEDEETEGPPEAYRGTVFRINAEDGQILGSHSGFRRPSGVVADEAGTLIVVARGFKPREPPLKATIFQIKANGDATVLVEERFKRPKGLVRDVLGQVFLAVKKDPEAPKDGGLLLKVAPDGTFTRFAQGFERPWGLAFDPQGNFYVTDPKAGRIYRFLAPAPPSLADHPATTREAQVTLAGTTEPEARITVRGGKEEVTTVADAQGKFTLEVPLNPDQVSTLKVYATGAKGEGLTSTATIATIQQQTTAPPPSIVLVVQITEPSPGSTVTSDSVLVRGTIEAGGLEVGVTVNSFPATVVGNTFAALVPVTPETTALTAIAAAISVATVVATIPVTVQPVTAPGIVLQAFPAGGAPPLTVTFHLENNTGRTLVRFELDVEGDGRVDVTTITFDEPQTTYTTPGIVVPTLRATDDKGQVYTASTLVTVGGTPPLEPKWEGMKDALRRGDIPAALSFVHTESRTRYEAVFRLLTPEQLTSIDQYLTTALPLKIGHNGAEYEIRRSRGGKVLSFPIWFQVDSDGIWRIRAF
ncbi:MAG TPA: Ig-like domain-containing protein, partial [Methylomirabilota bacterium]|nr:Ig-like domain-containing protein [Methylomirabilota bacterium]